MSYTKINLRQDTENMAERHGLAPDLESRFARQALELEQSGVSYFKLAPGFRVPFGHTHSEQEEVYVVISGGARFKVEDELVELAELDALRVPANTTRGMEAGPDGAELIAFGAPNTENKDAQMFPGWWV